MVRVSRVQYSSDIVRDGQFWPDLIRFAATDPRVLIFSRLDSDGNSSVSKSAQVTITTLAFGTEASGLNASKVHGYSLSQPLNLASLLPNAFQPGTSDEDRAAFRYNAYDYNLSLASQPLDIRSGSEIDGFLTVLEAYTVPSAVNGLLWTNRATLPVRLIRSQRSAD